MAERRRAALATLAACLGLAFAVYWPALSDGFYNDDALFLNVSARVLEAPSRLFTETPLGYFRPAWLAYVALQRLLFGLAPLGYHALGLVLHGGVGFLVYLLARRLLRDGVAALAAAATFLCLYAHSEAVLWISAHNSTLAAGLCVGALLLHLRAVESRRWGAALLTALVVLLALWTKEPAAVLLAWLPLAEMLTAGWRSPFTRAGLLRAAPIAAAVAVFVFSNPSIAAAFAAQDEPANAGVRATFAFLEPGRVLGACATLFSPRFEPEAHAGPDALGVAAGVLVLVLPLVVVAGVVLATRSRRDLLAPTALALLLLLSALLPACMTRQQQPNGSRLYYFPTVGAALLVGVAVALAREPRPLRVALLLLLATGLGWHVAAIRASDARDYRPVSRAQTATARQMGPVLAAADGHTVILIEPWIDNLVHLQEFLALYCGVERARVLRVVQPRAEVPDWLTRQRQLDPGLQVLDWDEARGLVPFAGALPPNRNAAPGQPHLRAQSPRLPHFTAYRILPAAAPRAPTTRTAPAAPPRTPPPR